MLFMEEELVLKNNCISILEGQYGQAKGFHINEVKVVKTNANKLILGQLVETIIKISYFTKREGEAICFCLMGSDREFIACTDEVE